MIRDRNLDPNTDAFKESVLLGINAGASLAGQEHGAWRAPYTGKLLSAHLRTSTLTDADDSVRVELHKNGVTMLAAPVDPVAAATTIALTLTVTTFEADDLLALVLVTGVGDAMVGTVTLVVRPYLGAPERFAAKAAGIAITP